MRPDPRIPDADTLRQLLEAGETRQQIVKRYGCLMDTLTYRLKKHGLLEPTQSLTPSQDKLSRENVAEDLRAGMKLAHIDRKYGVTTGTTHRFIKAHNLVAGAPRGVRFFPDKTIINGVSLPPNSLHRDALQAAA